jgi:hypothetical protein
MREHRSRFLLLVAIFLAVKIFFDIVRIHQMRERTKQWEALAESTYKTCQESVKNCEAITHKPCGVCTEPSK